MEQWRSIPGFPRHMISSEGRVFSWHSQKFLTPGIGSHGYLKLNLGFGKTRLVHVLVAEAFLGPRPAGQVVRHRDDNRQNPRLANLKYGTYAENTQDALRSRRHSGFSRERALKSWATRRARQCAA